MTEPNGDKKRSAQQNSASRTASRKKAKVPAKTADKRSAKSNTRQKARPSENEDSWFNRISDLTSSAFRIARITTDGSLRVGKTILRNQDQLKLMSAAGQSLKDLREVTGLTIHELSDAINLKDKSIWEAVEDGTATLSFELILRLAALLARNDPVPFILKYTRTYNPELWKVLNDWGVGRLPLQYEREREFINIYRRHDAARQLSDEGFERVLKFTQNAFDMALHFVAETEQVKIPAEDSSANGQNQGHKKEKTAEKAVKSDRGTEAKREESEAKSTAKRSNSDK